MRRPVARTNKRQKKPKGESIKDWYLHPTKGWKRERLHRRINVAAAENRWATFLTTLPGRKKA